MRSPTLFWRTFLLIVLLLVAAVTAWLQSFRVFEREPRARQVSQQLISIVNITRAALLHSDPVRRRALLADLADNEGIRVLLREDDDRIVDVPDTPFARLTTSLIREQLGADTRIGTEVNGVAGIWVSFDIDGDDYWVFAARDPLSRDIGRQWIGWAAAALALSLLVAVAITRVVNLPLARLSNAARAIGRGQAPPTLPDQGPPEIRTVNASFNRMVADLAKLEQDRAVLLAGISHDLRTPLARLRLEIELNPLGEETRHAMLGDLEQMDGIVGQFLDYARPAAAATGNRRRPQRGRRRSGGAHARHPPRERHGRHRDRTGRRAAWPRGGVAARGRQPRHQRAALRARSGEPGDRTRHRPADAGRRGAIERLRPGARHSARVDRTPAAAVRTW